MMPDESQIETTGENAINPGRIGNARALFNRFPWIPVAAVVFLMFGLALVVFSLGSQDDRRLFPILPTYTPLAATADYEPVPLGFVELNEDPVAFQGRRIQVSGTYTPIAGPDCVNYNGPVIRWSLVADELQLNAIGFENLLSLIDEGTPMTVTGIWNAYRGPVGCGKEPPDGTVWYLAVDRILEPNPLLSSSGIILTVIPGDPLPTLSPFETVDPQAPTLEPTIDLTSVMTLTVSPQATFLITPTQILGPTSQPVTPLFTPGVTPAITITPTLSGTSNSTPTLDANVTPEGTPDLEGTTTPELPTNTPSGTGYPDSEPTPTATTQSGYP